MDFLTVNETARLLRVSPITVRRYIASGRLAAERVGRGIRVRREAIEAFIMPVVSSPVKPESDSEEDVPALLEAMGNSVGIVRSGEQTNIAELKDEYIADAVYESDSDEVEVPDDLLGKPTSIDDPLWNIVGIGCSDEPNDVASNKHKYLAEAILAKMK
jgi:excisionase family DNA binding protein